MRFAVGTEMFTDMPGLEIEDIAEQLIGTQIADEDNNVIGKITDTTVNGDKTISISANLFERDEIMFDASNINLASYNTQDMVDNN